MGAGSAKGINSVDEDLEIENDRFSVISQEDSETTAAAPLSRKILEENTSLLDLSDTEGSAIADSSDDPKTLTEMVKRDQESKKHQRGAGGLFGFAKWKESPPDDNNAEKTSAFVHEDGTAGKAKPEPKKDSKGFKLFGNWRKEEKSKDTEALDQEINDLHKTFDSLGIENKDNNNAGKNPRNKSQSADDIRKLSPMRNRIKPRNLRTSHSRRNTDTIANGTSSSGGSRRNFKYSWETEQNANTAPNLDDDTWSYKAVLIEGFDIEKFKMANFDDANIPSTIPNSVIDDNNEDEDSSMLPRSDGTKSPLVYDPMEQKLLSTIERDFIY